MKRSDIYKALRDHAQTTIPFLQYIDLQKGQMQYPKQNYPLPLPALLIEIGQVSWTNLASHNQIGELIIKISLYQDNQADSFSGAELEKESLSLLNNDDLVFAAFEGFSTQDLQPLVRQRDGDPEYGKRYMCFTTEFKTVIEQGISPETQTIEKPPLKFRLQ